MTSRRLPRTLRLAVGLGAVAAAVVTAAAIAGAGSAQSSPQTLHLEGTAQKSIGFGPNHKPHQGDRIGGGSKITGDETCKKAPAATK